MENIPFDSNDTNNDVENRQPGDRPQKLNVGIAHQIPKRRALSNLTSNIRVQPSRAAKPKVGTFINAKASEQLQQKHGNSEIFHIPPPALPPGQNFTVFQDECEVRKTAISTCKTSENLPENVTALHKGEGFQRTALATLPCLSTLSPKEERDSPMLLDTSQDSSYKESLHEKYVLQNSHYTHDIYQCLRESEQKFRPKPAYMRKQPDITHGMRSILVDWLVEVAEEYKLQLETLYLAVSYIDRFLSSMSVLRSKLQLVGTASMFIAAKYEEIYPPDVGEFVYITDDTYTKKQVLRMEQLILKVLSFDLAVPTIYCFLQFFCAVGEIPEVTEHLAQYLCELSLLEADPFLRFLPSHIAAAGLSLACHTLGCEPWSEELYTYTGFNLESFQECLHCLYKSFCNANSYPQQAVREKYKASKFHGVSRISPPPTVPC